MRSRPLDSEQLILLGLPELGDGHVNWIKSNDNSEPGRSDVETIVVSHDILRDTRFKTEIETFDCTTLLIADEVHNLGSEGFITDLPSFFDYRLGLSATPIRQYDEHGTEVMFSFFGPVVFQFALQEAIGRCLVEYDYYVHPVDLTQDEMDKWHELTEKIKRNAWRSEHEEPDEYITKLLTARRAILETAENKIAALEEVLIREDISDAATHVDLCFGQGS